MQQSVVSQLGILPPQYVEEPEGWDVFSGTYGGYLAAPIPLLRANAYKGQLRCLYGMTSNGAWLTRLEQFTPKGFWCSPVNDGDFIGFDCNPW